MLAGVGGQLEWQDPITGPARSSGRDGGERPHLSGGGGAIWGERCQLVKWSQRFRATGSAAAAKMGGRRPLRLVGEREWLLARIAEKPDLTLRAVMAELAERGAPGELRRGMALFRPRGDQL